jgi:hypothetical protein
MGSLRIWEVYIVLNGKTWEVFPCFRRLPIDKIRIQQHFPHGKSTHMFFLYFPRLPMYTQVVRNFSAEAYWTPPIAGDTLGLRHEGDCRILPVPGVRETCKETLMPRLCGLGLRALVSWFFASVYSSGEGVGTFQEQESRVFEAYRGQAVRDCQCSSHIRHHF